MKILLVFFLLSFFLSSCEEKDLSGSTPDCIQDMIDEIAAGPVWSPPAKIYRYKYDGQTVYFIPARCCDVPSFLYDEDCNFLCSPDGGITGAGDGQCSDFFDTRTDGVLFWEDTRE